MEQNQNPNIEKTENTAPANLEAPQAKNTKVASPEQQIERFAKGEITLYAPIRAGGKDVAVLAYDFRALTGWELLDALDGDIKARSTFTLTNKQALLLFAKAAAKETEGVDEIDIKERISPTDAIKAVQLATLFYLASSRAGMNRVTSQ